MKNSSNSSKRIKGKGNTKLSPVVCKQVSCAKRWCLTWNNYDKDWFKKIVPIVPGFEGYIFGLEIGESGTKHIQGYIEFKKKCRPMGMLPKEVHWEKCKGNRMQNIEYCSKDGDYKCSKNFKPPRKVKTITKLRPWQQKIADLCDKEPDDRSIHWYWEEHGNVGKSALTKYLCMNYNCVVVSGKATDMKNAIVNYRKGTGRYPDVCIFDIPRSCLDYISYTGMEEIKNGCFSSSKYECEMVIMPHPHILCFANEEPDTNKMSADRWKITCIDK